MTAPKKDNLIDWLRDAHGMEEQAEKMLSAQSARLEHYPPLRQRIEQHIKETQEQRQVIESCLSRLGSRPSTLKDMGGKLMALGQAIGGAPMSDEVIKGAISGYVFENIEIATYTVIIAAAADIGDSETQQACERILEQEKAMAAWLLDNLPATTRAFLERSADPDLTAKR